MTIKDVANKLGVTERSVYGYIRSQKGIGKHFYRDEYGRWAIDGRRVKKHK